MKIPVMAFAAVLTCLGLGLAAQQPSHPPFTFAADGKLNFPTDYRTWVFVTSGFDMSYSARSGDMHMFDNVFVNLASYAAFQKTGHWPDKTMFVLESRAANGKGSINKHGNYQNTELMGIEVHVRDDARFPGKWAFFSFDGGVKQADAIPATADCYSCHQQHGVVDTTFVQFYPTLLPIAKEKGSISASLMTEFAPAEAGSNNVGAKP